jgi:hypothetical protein
MELYEALPGTRVALSSTNNNGLLEITGRIVGRVADAWGELSSGFVIQLDEPLELMRTDGLRMALSTLTLFRVENLRKL